MSRTDDFVRSVEDVFAECTYKTPWHLQTMVSNWAIHVSKFGLEAEAETGSKIKKSYTVATKDMPAAILYAHALANHSVFIPAFIKVPSAAIDYITKLCAHCNYKKNIERYGDSVTTELVQRHEQYRLTALHTEIPNKKKTHPGFMYSSSFGETVYVGVATLSNSFMAFFVDHFSGTLFVHEVTENNYFYDMVSALNLFIARYGCPRQIVLINIAYAPEILKWASQEVRSATVFSAVTRNDRQIPPAVSRALSTITGYERWTKVGDAELWSMVPRLENWNFDTRPQINLARFLSTNNVIIAGPCFRTNPSPLMRTLPAPTVYSLPPATFPPPDSAQISMLKFGYDSIVYEGCVPHPHPAQHEWSCFHEHDNFSDPYHASQKTVHMLYVIWCVMGQGMVIDEVELCWEKDKNHIFDELKSPTFEGLLPILIDETEQEQPNKAPIEIVTTDEDEVVVDTIPKEYLPETKKNGHNGEALPAGSRRQSRRRRM